MRLSKILTPPALLALVAVSAAAPASSIADAAPAPGCYAPFTDPAGDHNPGAPSTATAVQNVQEPDSGDVNLDILEAWLDYDASKGDKGLTANIRIADLSTRAAQPGTGVIWNFIFDVEGQTRFVRAFTDLTGGPYFEWGIRQPASTDYLLAGEVPENPMPLPRFVYQGATEGQLFEGKNGVVQIVIPKEAGGGAGAVLEAPQATANASKQVVPAAVNQAPSRGISTQVDIAPDGATPGAGAETFSAATCSPVADLGGDKGGLVDDVVDGVAPAPPAPPSADPPAAPAPAPQASALTVSLAKATAKRVKKGRTLTLSLRSTETLSGVTVKLLKGRTVVAKGAAKQLAGSGAVKLRVGKALRKGTYTVAVTGTDASGAKRTATTSLKVR